MKNTSELSVFSNDYLPENKIVIHPNDGFDLGFMQFNEILQMQVNENHCDGNPVPRCMSGTLTLENACKPGTIQLNPKLWHHMGKPEKIILIFKEDKLFLVNR
jgi:hypothetical protein